MIISAHESLDGFCIVHAKLLENIMSILGLANQSTIFNLLNLKAKKEYEFTHHRHFKPFYHDLAKLITKGFISRPKDNIININLTYK
jgi:hypothetical protein